MGVAGAGVVGKDLGGQICIGLLPGRSVILRGPFAAQHAGQAGNAAAAGKALKAAGLAVANGAVGAQAHMADLAAHIGVTAQQAAFGDDASAHAGAHGQKNHIVAALAGAQLPLHQRACIGVVLQIDRHAEFFAQHVADRDIIPAGQVGRRLDDAAAGIQRAAAGDADGVHRPVTGGKCGFQRGEEFCESGAKTLFCMGIEPIFGQDVDGFAHICGQNGAFCAADVDSDDALHSVASRGVKCGVVTMIPPGAADCNRLAQNKDRERVFSRS